MTNLNVGGKLARNRHSKFRLNWIHTMRYILCETFYILLKYRSIYDFGFGSCIRRVRPVQEPFVWLTTSDWFPGLCDQHSSLSPTLERVRESEWVRERERANVIAMRPKLTKRKPQQKQTMRTALKFFKKFHVSCRSFSFSLSMHFPLLRNSTTPWWAACYGLLCLFLLGDARRRDDYRKVFEAKLFLSFFYSSFFWGYLAVSGELGNLLNCAMERNFLSRWR